MSKCQNVSHLLLMLCLECLKVLLVLEWESLEVVMIRSLLTVLTVVRTWKLLPSCWLICFSSNSILVSWAAPELRTVNGEFLGYQISWRERSSLPGLAGQVNTLQLRDPNLTRSDSLTVWHLLGCYYISSNTAGCKVQPKKKNIMFLIYL